MTVRERCASGDGPQDGVDEREFVARLDADEDSPPRRVVLDVPGRSSEWDRGDGATGTSVRDDERTGRPLVGDVDRIPNRVVRHPVRHDAAACRQRMRRVRVSIAISSCAAVAVANADEGGGRGARRGRPEARGSCRSSAGARCRTRAACRRPGERCRGADRPGRLPDSRSGDSARRAERSPPAAKADLRRPQSAPGHGSEPAQSDESDGQHAPDARHAITSGAPHAVSVRDGDRALLSVVEVDGPGGIPSPDRKLRRLLLCPLSYGPAPRIARRCAAALCAGSRHPTVVNVKRRRRACGAHAIVSS